MGTSWILKAKQFKSPASVVAGFLFRSREVQAAKVQNLKQQCQTLQKELHQQNQSLARQAEEIARLKQKVRALEIARSEASKGPWGLPVDPPVGSHGFGASRISLAVNLAQAVRLRGAARALRVFLIGCR